MSGPALASMNTSELSRNNASIFNLANIRDNYSSRFGKICALILIISLKPQSAASCLSLNDEKRGVKYKATSPFFKVKYSEAQLGI